MRPFLAKVNHEFREADFLASPIWATYYEPDEIATLVELGFDRSEVERVVSQIKGNDEYSFPLPPQAAVASFKYLYLGVRATTKGGSVLTGFLTGPCLGVFCGGKDYLFNKGLKTHSIQAARELAEALGEKSVFPMRIEIMATGQVIEQDLW